MKLSVKLAVAAFAAATQALAAHAAHVQSISRIAFGPDNTLFVADWKAATVQALKLPAANRMPAAPFNIRDLGGLLARAWQTRVTVTDMAVRPGTGQAYVAVEYGPARRRRCLS